MKKLGIIGGISGLFVLGILLGAFFAGPLLASASSQASQSTTTTAAATPGTASAYCTTYMASLAKRLGVSVSTLQTDQQGAVEDVLAQLVKDGKLTQAQADQIKSKLGDAVQCNLAGLGKGLDFGQGKGHINMQNMQKYLTIVEADVAKGLHLTSDQLQTKLQAGQSLSDIAKAQNVSATQLQALMKSAIQDALKQAVANGDMTQAQADQFSQKLANNPQALQKLLSSKFGQGAGSWQTGVNQ